MSFSVSTLIQTPDPTRSSESDPSSHHSPPQRPSPRRRARRKRPPYRTSWNTRRIKSKNSCLILYKERCSEPSLSFRGNHSLCHWLTMHRLMRESSCRLQPGWAAITQKSAANLGRESIEISQFKRTVLYAAHRSFDRINSVLHHPRSAIREIPRYRSCAKTPTFDAGPEDRLLGDSTASELWRPL